MCRKLSEGGRTQQQELSPWDTQGSPESLWPSLGLLRTTWSGSLEVGTGLLGALCAHGPRGACGEDGNRSWHSTAVDLSVLNLSMQPLCLLLARGSRQSRWRFPGCRKGAPVHSVPAGTPSCCHSHRASNVYETWGRDLLVRSRALSTVLCAGKWGLPFTAFSRNIHVEYLQHTAQRLVLSCPN